uniref:Uncharacterized protein n=1 Tax=Rhizophora mucronata TaxID=61149 RepID=A0A2P2J701_RHIMU
MTAKEKLSTTKNWELQTKLHLQRFLEKCASVFGGPGLPTS